MFQACVPQRLLIQSAQLQPGFPQRLQEFQGLKPLRCLTDGLCESQLAGLDLPGHLNWKISALFDR